MSNARHHTLRRWGVLITTLAFILGLVGFRHDGITGLTIWCAALGLLGLPLAMAGEGR